MTPAGRPEALTAYQQALPVQEALAHDYPKFIGYQAIWPRAISPWQGCCTRPADSTVLRRSFGKGSSSWRHCAASIPRPRLIAPSQAALYLQLGELAADTGRTAQAEESYRQSSTLREELARESGDKVYALDVAETLVRLGDLDRTAGRNDGARQRYQQALNLLEKVTPDKADVAGWQASVASCCNRLGMAYHAEGRDDQARSAWQRALATLGQAAPLAVPLAERRRRQQSAKARDGLGALALTAGDLSNAASHFHAALDIRQQLARRSIRVR